MSQIKITTGGHSVEVAEDGASAGRLLSVALRAWRATVPESGQPVGFSGVAGSAERASNGAAYARFERRPAHVTSGGES